MFIDVNAWSTKDPVLQSQSSFDNGSTLPATLTNMFKSLMQKKKQLNSVILREGNVIVANPEIYKKLMKGYLRSNFILKYFVVFKL